MTPSHHRPVFSCLLLGAFALAVALPLSGCASKTKRARAEAAAKVERYTTPMSTELGRVLSYDPSAANVLIEFSSFARPPSDLAGRVLISRNRDTLEPTARLVAASHRVGRVFGAHVVAGQPSPDDEVIIPPPF